ncbi:hypothetical protein MACJ_000977 [Theileria orientalis]|uniref:Uncharacterized protein n=1 Tax=Theileria orientalis TaxID=68886 RepID=A0A976QRT4_THEOR|nr:hypothetical protein MACJ_000977 [Theileria orientalis]
MEQLVVMHLVPHLSPLMQMLQQLLAMMLTDQVQLVRIKKKHLNLKKERLLNPVQLKVLKKEQLLSQHQLHLHLYHPQVVNVLLLNPFQQLHDLNHDLLPKRLLLQDRLVVYQLVWTTMKIRLDHLKVKKDGLEISTLDPSDSQKTVVNDTNSYEISHEKGNIIYKFKSNTKCVLIKCDDKDLWKRGRGEDENEMYPQYIVMVSRFIFVVFEGYFKLYQKKMDECKELYDSTPELKQLNIRKNNEKFYDYIKDDKAKIYKYLVKNDVLFNSVKKGKNSCNCGTELAIWDTKFPEEYATKVIRKESGKKDKYLCVYYYNGNYSLFFKRKGAKFWQDETSEKFFSSDFRFHTLNEKGTQYEELEPSKREVTLDGFIKRYKFTVGADCHEIRCRNVKLWSHDKIKFGDDYPKEMSLNLLNNQVTVKLDAVHFVYDYNGEDLIWKLNSVDMGEYYMARLTVVTVDENGSNSSENNTNRYELNKYKTGLAYKIKENGKFTEVKNGSKSMWRHVDGSDHPKILYHDIRNNTLFIRFKDSVGICNGGESRSVKAGEDVPKVDDLLLVTLDDNGNRKENKTKESADTQDGSSPEENETGDSSSQNPGNDSSKKNHPPDFTKEAMDNEETIRRYIFGDKVRCVEVKLGGESLWTHEVNKHGREYPKEIIVNLAIATLTINFDSQLNYIYVHDGDKWKLESENNLFDYYLNKFTIVTADDGEGNNSRENDELEYSIEKQNNLFTLFLHEEAKCIKVKYEEQVVWSYKQENADAFARSVSCNPQSGSLAVDTDGGSFKFTMENGLWTAVDPSVPLPVSKHPQGLTIITLEEGAEGAEERVENNYNLYNVYDRGNDCYLYHFPEGVKCVEFRFGDRKIWSYHLKYKNKYPESITVELGPGIVEIEIGDKTLPYRLYEEE